MNLFTLTQGDTQPALTGVVLYNADGTVVDLTAASVNLIYRLAGATEWTSRTATIEDGTAGTVGYQWVAADTATVGNYYFAFEVTFESGDVETFPNDGYYEFSVIGQLDSETEVTPWSRFYGPLRAILGDFDPDIHIYDDDTLKETLKLVIDLNKVPGYVSSHLGVEPELVPADDPESYGRLLWYAAKYFSVGITSTSFTSRAFSERLGEPSELVASIIEEIARLENGVMVE